MAKKKAAEPKATPKAPAAKASRKPASAPPASAPQVAAPMATGKLSALDAAAKVLAEVGQALNCQQLIEAMAAKGYWTSPAGRTPASTLYASITKEVAAKGAAARFVKVARGQFALAPR
jgi:hypothetical protein